MEKIPLFKVAMNPQVTEKVASVLESGYVGEGPWSKKFEDLLKLHYSNENLLLTNSGTSAIHLALDVIRETYNLIPEETDVLCTCLSCLATIMPVKSQGFNIKWIDIDPKSLNINLEDVENKLTAKTRILIVVHWGGNPVDIEKLDWIKAEYKAMYKQELIIIEDAAHCFGSFYNNGVLVGNSGNYVCSSFQAIKFLTTGDGGMLITPDADSAKQAKLKRWFGLDRDNGQDMRCTQSVIYNGFKMQPNDITSVIGYYNYPLATANVGIHKRNAAYYNSELGCFTDLRIINPNKNRHDKTSSSYWLYTIFVERKKDFKKYMEENGVAVSEVHARMDIHPIYSKYTTKLPHMDSVENHYISIPVGWWVTKENREYIINLIKKGW